MKPSKDLMLVAGMSALFALGACSSSGKKDNIDSDEGLQITLNQCSHLNNQFQCELSLLSETQNASLEIKDNTLLEDDQGNEYPLTGGNVENQEVRNGMYAKVQKELTAGSPVAATFIFQNIAANATSVKELTVAGRIKIHNNPNWKNFKVSLELPKEAK